VIEPRPLEHLADHRDQQLGVRAVVPDGHGGQDAGLGAGGDAGDRSRGVDANDERRRHLFSCSICEIVLWHYDTVPRRHVERDPAPG
jgi:hypothetical protein